VYLATDVRHHRPVAIKVLHPGVLGAELFLRATTSPSKIGIALRNFGPSPIVDPCPDSLGPKKSAACRAVGDAKRISGSRRGPLHSGSRLRRAEN
jgi:hypothetical protein